MIKVSIIVPVYNVEEYLAKCLDSILAQTLEEIEIIAIDNGSTDSSLKILLNYASNHNKIKMFKIQSRGLSNARNFGLLQAEGEYVGYVDSDDFVDPNMFETMYKKAKEQDSVIVECSLHHTYANKEYPELIKKYYTQSELLCYGRYIVWNKIYHREWMLESKAQFPLNTIYEDVGFTVNLIPHITKYDYVDIAPYYYLQRRGSLSNKSCEKTMDIFIILQYISDYYKKNCFYTQYRQELEFLYIRILLLSSFRRMCAIQDRKLRKRALKLNRCFLVDSFPQWRKNFILKKDKTSKAFFMKMQNSLIYKICSVILPICLRIKARLVSE